MRVLLTEDFVAIPSDVTIKCKSRKISVCGPRGEVAKDFSHLPCEIQRVDTGNKNKKGDFLRIRMWFGGYK